MKFYKFIHQLATLAVLVTLPFIFYWRVSLVDATIGRRFGLEGAYDAAVLNADGPLLFSIGLLILGSWFTRNHLFSVMLRIFALLLVLLYIVDLIVFKQFGIRVLFSSIQLYGGVNDWTPETDALSSQAVVFNNMHATSFSTNEGLIGILGGVRLFSPFSHLFRAVVPFETAWGLENTVPREFNAAGYHTVFLTLGSLDITRKGDWIRDIGFQEIEGSESPFYDDWPRIQYNAAADEALYARGLDWVASRPPGQPWMLTLLTISTHQPYRNPQTRVPDMEQTFRYADREAAKFIRELETSGFFDNGILLILGDHRSMTPISKEEQRLFGTSAPSRVPLALFGEGGPEKRDGVFHHSDLLPSFRNWLNDESCEEDASMSIFDPDSQGRCAFHVRGSQPSLVDVFCPEGHGLIKLDGDSTRFLNSDGISTEQQTIILQVVAKERLAGHQRHLDYMENP